MNHLAWPGLITVVPVEPFWLLDIMEIGGAEQRKWAWEIGISPKKSMDL